MLVACGGALDEPWQSTIGSDAADTSFGAAATPDGDVVVAAATEGALAGDHAGQRDVYVGKFTKDGDEIWSTQLGSEAGDSPLGVSVAPDGSIYMGGFSDGSFAGENAGSADIWVAQLDPDGTEVWRRQFGGDGWDRGFDVTAFEGGVYVSGYTASVLDEGTNHEGFDGFAARFDADGTMEWVRQFGTDAADWGQGSSLAPDGGLYVTGYTEGAMAGEHQGDKDAFVLRLSPTGDEVWVRQFGTPVLDWPQGVGTTNDGGVIVAGSTMGDLGAFNAGDRDAFVAAFDETGRQLFKTQFGDAAADSVFEVRATADGFIATGSTGAVTSEQSGQRNGMLAWFDSEGGVTFVESAGSSATVDYTGLDVSDDSVVFFSGSQAVEGDIDVLIGARTGPPDG